MYASTLDQIKMLYNVNRELAGELAISAIELLLCGDVSSDDPMIKVMLTPSKVVRDRDKQKHDLKVENAKLKKINDQKLDLIAELYNQGFTQARIGERLGLTQQTVSNRMGIIRAEFPHLLQAKNTKIQAKSTSNLQEVCTNTSDLLVQDCTNIVPVVQNGTNCENGTNCTLVKMESETEKSVKETVERPYFDF